MQQFFSDFYDRLHDLHKHIAAALDGLSQAGVDWVPGPATNSIGVLAAHVAGSERYWIGEIAGGHAAERNRDAEFQTHGTSSEVLRQRLDQSLEHARGVLEGLTLTDLEAARISPRHNRTYTVGWALAHALEHTATHVGHIQITRQLWDQQAQH